MGDGPDWTRNYATLLEDLKARVLAVQHQASLAVDRELVLLYWSIGRDILARQADLGWGAKADEDFVQQAAARLPWFHNVAILGRGKEPQVRRFYVEACAQQVWSRNVLRVQMETQLHKRQRRAPTNFAATLPSPQSDLAQQVIKDPYVFDFLTLAADARERDLERGLLAHLRDFLIELGVGFAFAGSQVHLEVGGEDFYIDLLFYHLRCFVVVELKMGSFQPEYAGKMNFYLSAVDAQLRHPSDQPTIAILLCKDRNDLTGRGGGRLRDPDHPGARASAPGPDDRDPRRRPRDRRARAGDDRPHPDLAPPYRSPAGGALRRGVRHSRRLARWPGGAAEAAGAPAPVPTGAALAGGEIDAGTYRSVAELARAEGVNHARVGKVLDLLRLPRELMQALDAEPDRLPVGLTQKKAMRIARMRTAEELRVALATYTAPN